MVNLQPHRDHRVFAGASDATVQHLEAHGEVMTFSNNERVWQQGIDSSVLWLVTDGHLVVICDLGDAPPLVVWEPTTGQVAAFASMIRGEPCVTSASPRGVTSMIGISLREVRVALRRDPGFLHSLMKLSLQRQHKLLDRLDQTDVTDSARRSSARYCRCSAPRPTPVCCEARKRRVDAVRGEPDSAAIALLARMAGFDDSATRRIVGRWESESEPSFDVRS